MKKTTTTKADGGKHNCDVYRCTERACVDFGRHVGPIGREARFLCCLHARGVKGHLDVHPDFKLAQVQA